MVDQNTPAGIPAAPPCTLVIFGAGGDLTKRLLMPALYNLNHMKLLDDAFKIVGVDHGQQDTDAWRKSLTETMYEFAKDPTGEFHAEIDPPTWDWVAKRLEYVSGDFEKPETFKTVGEKIGNASVIFYLAVAARFFGTIVEGLGSAGLLKESDGAFHNVIIEKPFGHDLGSARELDALLLKNGAEHQFYRIDHFTGKEPVQSISALRFGNGIYEPLWRRDHIDHVQITAAETIGVEMRGGFYEATGALRDMVPNHLFQLMAIVAMEPPNSFSSESVRNEKSKVLEAIVPIPPQDAVRGQYAGGTIGKKPMKGYREEPDVAKDSTTETFVALKLHIENWRWSGVPFYVRTGKRMSDRLTSVSIVFKSAPYRLFRDTPTESMKPNVLTFYIDPKHGLATDMSVKIPGPTMRLGSVYTHFDYGEFFEPQPTVGYESLIYDCMRADQTLYQRADGIEASWSAVQPVIDAWSKSGESLEFYPAGSKGPAGADALLERDGRAWLPLVAAEEKPKTAEAH